MRATVPAEPAHSMTPEDLAGEISFFRGIGQNAHSIIKTAGIRTTMGLWGMPLLHSLDTTSLCALLNEIPAGNWELMTHPGYPSPHGKPFENEQRLTELNALCAEQVKEVIRQRQINLCTFGDLRCAS